MEDAELNRFAAVESNALRVLSETHQAEPEVGLHALLCDIQWH
jgi:hypothetical protein